MNITVRILMLIALMWLQDYAKFKRKTWEQDQRTLEVDVLTNVEGHDTALAMTEVDKVRRGHVMEVVGAVAGRGSPPPSRQADKVGTLISGIFNWAIEHGKIERDNPAAKLPKYHGNESRDRYLCDDEIAQLWHALPAIFPDEPRRIMVKLLLLTGCRKMEIVGARKTELAGLDSDRPTFNLPGDKTVKGKLVRGRTKNSAPHTVELSPLAAHLCTRAVALSDSAMYVFPSERTDAPFDERNIDKALRRALEGRKRSFEVVDGRRVMKMVPTEPLLKMPPFVIHDLRRTCATGMARLRVDERIISRCLNHVTPIKASITSRAYVREICARPSGSVQGLGCLRRQGGRHHRLCRRRRALRLRKMPS
ncbi:MAG: tyrosine-type recombinase/integrase [Hyphomicrobium aestuarii]|nr:tyrosine-type recombinase/integrase [Hyphomicrobium aestuarii]